MKESLNPFVTLSTIPHIKVLSLFHLGVLYPRIDCDTLYTVETGHLAVIAMYVSYLMNNETKSEFCKRCLMKKKKFFQD